MQNTNMTDIQFKAVVKICLTIAENTRDIKDFKKAIHLPDSGFGSAFVLLVSRMADSLNDMEKVRQILTDIIMMEVD